MQRDDIEERFLRAMQESYRMVARHGVRSNAKTKILHGWVQDELMRELGEGYDFTGQSPDSAREAGVAGMYYDKKVDVLVSRADEALAVVSVKFVISNYWQNSINYLEQQIGETANLRRRNIVYGNLFCVTNPIPYKDRGGQVVRLEALREHDVQRYARLRADHEHLHAPQEMAIGIVELDIDADVITGVANPADMGISAAGCADLGGALSVSLFFRRMARRIELRHLSP